VTPGNRIASSLLALGVINPGDGASYPDPGPQYFRAAICLADGNPRKFGLIESNDYIVNVAGLKNQRKTKILFLNYPHNPTGASVDYYFYRELLRSLRFWNVLIACDCAHVYPGNPDPNGPLQVKNAIRQTVELHTFAMTFGIAGLGFAVGHKDVISTIKNLMRSLGFAPNTANMQFAMACLDHADELFADRMESLRKKRDILIEGLKKLGWHVRSGRLTPFLWVRPPVRSTSLAFSRRLFIKAGIKVTPGSDYGENGEGWIRMTLAGDEKTMTETVSRLTEHSRIWQRKYRPE
jgi:LL-diaminopimelate aminotransferase